MRRVLKLMSVAATIGACVGCASESEKSAAPADAGDGDANGTPTSPSPQPEEGMDDDEEPSPDGPLEPEPSPGEPEPAAPSPGGADDDATDPEPSPVAEEPDVPSPEPEPSPAAEPSAEPTLEPAPEPGAEPEPVDGGAEPAPEPTVEPEPPAGSVPMFVAAGVGGRRTTSCDDGLTWIADAVDQPDPADYDHHEWLVRGLAYGDGAFVSFHGWGSEGRIRRSENGIDWQDVFPNDGDFYNNGFWSGAFGEGVFVGAGSAAAIRSTDGGQTWTDQGYLGVDDGHTTVVFGDGRFVAVQPGQAVYSDDGAQWQLADAFDCSEQMIAFGDGVFITASTGGETCRSTDGGETWEPGGNTEVPGETHTLLFTGSEFLALGSGVSSSVDGQTWTPGSNPGFSWVEGGATSSATGTIIVATGEAELLRSDDGGTSWETVLDGGGPFFRRVAFGFGAPSAECPATE